MTGPTARLIRTSRSLRYSNPVPLSLRADQGRPAAVLVGLQQQAAGWHVVMTRRAGHLAHHAGQISFPGGKVDPDDVGLVATALREAQEEIALSPAAVTILGALDIVASPVGFVVQPVVGLIAPGAILSRYRTRLMRCLSTPRLPMCLIPPSPARELSARCGARSG